MDRWAALGLIPFVGLVVLVAYGIYSIFYESVEEGCERVFKLTPSNPLDQDDIDSIVFKVVDAKAEFDRWSTELRLAYKGQDLDHLDHVKFEFDYAEQGLSDVANMAQRVFKVFSKDRPELVDNVQQLAYPAEQKPYAE